MSSDSRSKRLHRGDPHPDSGYPVRSARLIATHRIEHRDPYDPRYYTAITISVIGPTWDNPYCSVKVTVSNGAGTCRFRCADIRSLLGLLALDPDTQSKLQDAVLLANQEADAIAEDMRLALARRRLPEGAHLVQSNTGEIVADAERLLMYPRGRVREST